MAAPSTMIQVPPAEVQVGDLVFDGIASCRVLGEVDLGRLGPAWRARVLVGGAETVVPKAAVVTASRIVRPNAEVFLNGWAGCTGVLVHVLKETPRRYRVVFLRDAYRYRVGTVALVPKCAVRWLSVADVSASGVYAH